MNKYANKAEEQLWIEQSIKSLEQRVSKLETPLTETWDYRIRGDFGQLAKELSNLKAGEDLVFLQSDKDAIIYVAKKLGFI